MKILMASTPATGHINPLLAIGHVLMAEGHDLRILSGTWLRDRIERSGATFSAFPGKADFDLRNIHAVAPELATIPPGFEWLRAAGQRFFVDTVAAQHAGVEEVLSEFPADVIIADNTMFGMLPTLLRPRSERLPVVVCGTSFLHWLRKDGAPHFLGLPPATTPMELEKYAALADEYERVTNGPWTQSINQVLHKLGLSPMSLPLFDSMVGLADSYMQLTVPSFEFPGERPAAVRFIGAPPIIGKQAPLPPWAGDLDGSRKVVLVTQGTVANHNFGLLVAPTLAGLANEPDVLVVATAGGRPVEAIPGPIPANARLASYLPFEWLLPKVDVLVTNGGYGSVNQAMSFGIPLVTAGLTEDKADVNMRVAWSGVGINLATNEPSAQAIREAVRSMLDTPRWRTRARAIADEFRAIDTRSEILRTVTEVAAGDKGARRSAPRPRPAQAQVAH